MTRDQLGPVGSEYVTTSESGISGSMPLGTVVVLQRDDGSDCPFFDRKDTGSRECCRLYSIEPLPLIQPGDVFYRSSPWINKIVLGTVLNESGETLVVFRAQDTDGSIRQEYRVEEYESEFTQGGLWKKEDPAKEMTMSEINKALGFEVKVIE